MGNQQHKYLIQLQETPNAVTTMAGGNFNIDVDGSFTGDMKNKGKMTIKADMAAGPGKNGDNNLITSMTGGNFNSKSKGNVTIKSHNDGKQSIDSKMFLLMI